MAAAADLPDAALSGPLWDQALSTAENMVELARKAQGFTSARKSRDQLPDPDPILNAAADFRDKHGDLAVPLLLLALTELAR
jgi:hypothetical protein